jgi:hypothetical protein
MVSLYFNQTIIPQAESVKYLCLQFDRRLTWKDHIAKKRKQINLKIKEINWLIGRKFHLSIENKVLIYKVIIKHIWSYGIELWGCASKSHGHHAKNSIQNSQSHSKCALECYKSYTPLRPQNPLRM